MPGRLAGLRREVQMVFGASLLGIATASCVPEPRNVQALTPKPPPPLHEPAKEQATGGSGDAGPPSAAVPVYGGSSVAIHAEVEYTRHSLVIDAEGERTLAALKEALEAFDCDISIQGHAGRDETNAAEWLSKRRAELVRERLIALGVDGSRLSVQGFGASRLRETSAHAPGRDRRVSFLFHAKANSGQRACDESDRRMP